MTPNLCLIFLQIGFFLRDKWVPVTTAWRVHRLRMEERPPIWRVAVNTLNKQSRTTDKGWSSSLGAGRDANHSSPYKRMLLRNIHRVSLRPGLYTIWTGDRHVWMRKWTFGLHTMRGISWLAENWLASQVGLCSMEWVSEWVRIFFLQN